MTAHLISYWLVIVKVGSLFKNQKVPIDLSQVALVTDRVAPISKRIYYKLGKIALSKAANVMKLLRSHQK